jgi:outer membrane protein assembly factor BamB
MNPRLPRSLFVIGLLLLSAVTQGAPGQLKWTFPTAGAIRSSPALGTNGLVYFGSIDGNVYAIEAGSGAERWRYSAGEPIHSSPAIAPNGSVIVASLSTLLALDAETGAARWKAYPGQLYSSPTVGGNGLVYVARYSYAALFACDLATGTNVWGGYMGNSDRVYASASIGADGTVYCGAGSQRYYDGPTFYAFNSTNGATKWTFRTINQVQSTPAIGCDGTVYIPSYDKLIYALDGQTGTQKWSHLLGDSVSSSPALGPDNAIYVGANDGRLYSLNIADGSERWNFLTGDTIHSSPALGADGTVYFGSYDKNIYALDARTGELKWSYPTENLVLSSPAIGNDGTIFIGSMDGKLYAIEGSSGPAVGPWPHFRAGIQPALPVSPRAMQIAVTPSDAAVVIRTIAGKVHHLESKKNLVQTQWQEALTFTGSGWDESRRDPQPPTDQLFYRVRVDQ